MAFESSDVDGSIVIVGANTAANFQHERDIATILIGITLAVGSNREEYRLSCASIGQ